MHAKVQQLIVDGFKPWGIVIPGAQNAPAGSKVHQFKRKRDTASVVLTAHGIFVRGMITFANGKIQNL